jgi:hypothetical protein
MTGAQVPHGQNQITGSEKQNEKILERNQSALTERIADQARRDKAEMATENLHQTKSMRSTELRNGEIKWTEPRWPCKPESGKKFLSLSGVAVNRKKGPVADLLGEEKNQPWSLCRAGPKLTAKRK